MQTSLLPAILFAKPTLGQVTIMSKLYSPHDRFFKRSMANIKVAQDFFRHHLPADILARVDLNTLQLKQTSFIDEHLGASAADILYSVKFDGQIGYFYLLCEQQSKPDKMMPFRVMGYKWDIMQQHLDQYGGHVLPIVYSLVFYTGQKPYHFSNDILDLFADRKLAEATLYEPFQLIKLQEVDDSEISRYKWSGMFEFVAKHIHDDDMLPHLKQVEAFVKAVENERFGDYEYPVIIFSYIASAGNIQNRAAFSETVKRVLPGRAGEEVMTIVEMYRHEGLQEGLYRGKEQGYFEGKLEVAKKLLLEGTPITIVAKVTELSIEQLQALQNEVLH